MPKIVGMPGGATQLPLALASLLQCQPFAVRAIFFGSGSSINQGLTLVHLLWVRVLCLLAVVPLAGWANAGQKVDIYSANVLVKGQSDAERNAAARASFGELMVRVSGRRDALEHPVIRQALPKAQNFLFGFTYKSTTEKITEEGKSFPALALQLNFEPRAVDQLLRDAQLPLWPAVRPKVLVWLVYRDATGLHQVPQVNELNTLAAQAKFRGLPALLPKLDLEDSLALTPEDLWAVDMEKIRAASLRYKADAILVGRYSPSDLGPIPQPKQPLQADSTVDAHDEAMAEVETQSSSVTQAQESSLPGELPVYTGPWLGDWQLVQGDELQSFSDETPDVAGLFANAMDSAADYFANQYAIAPTQSGPQAIVVRIGDIADFGAFKQAQRYLDELAMVQRVEVLSVKSDGLLVRLTIEGDIRLLMNTLALGRRLVPLQSESLGGGMELVPSVSAATPATQVTDSDTAVDAEEMADLERALALEANNFPSDATEAPVVAAANMQAGTLEDPLMYVWQK